jgi:hypothetical protein
MWNIAIHVYLCFQTQNGYIFAFFDICFGSFFAHKYFYISFHSILYPNQTYFKLSIKLLTVCLLKKQTNFSINRLLLIINKIKTLSLIQKFIKIYFTFRLHLKEIKFFKVFTRKPFNLLSQSIFKFISRKFSLT